MQNTPSIHELAMEGDIAGVYDALAAGVDIDLPDPSSGRTPLMAAVASPNASPAMVQALIERGANVNSVTTDPQSVVAMAGLQKLLHQLDDPSSALPESAKEMLRQLPASLANPQEHQPLKETPLSLALRGGNLEIIRKLLDAGADIHHRLPHGYSALINSMHGRPIAHDEQLLPILRLLIARGAELNTVTDYSESALNVASNMGRFDAVRLLLDAGADPAPLGWTPLMHAVVLGSLEEVKAHLDRGESLTTCDFWSRTPWLLSLQVGDIQKAKCLLAFGAARSDRGRCGKHPLTYPIVNDHLPMLEWLLSEEFNPNDTDEFGRTPLQEAAENGSIECARLLINAGADVHRTNDSEPLLKSVTHLQVARLLAEHGADLNDASREVRAVITRVPHDGKLRVSHEEYLDGKHRRFGGSNPAKMNLAFWNAMISSGLGAYAARSRFHDTQRLDAPVWSYQRHGTSLNELPDGRVIEIGGEHEDHYDPDFCIYNDVVVHHPDGRFDLFGYPADVFPPTDFHSATLIGNDLYLIGNLGYHHQRKHGFTQVLKLSVDTLKIEPVHATGESPGWISRHKAMLEPGPAIRIRGGKRWAIEGDQETYEDNEDEFILFVSTMTWKRIR